MVAFSRTCRLLVRRRDKVALVIADLPIHRGLVTGPTCRRGTEAGVEVGATIRPTCGEKKANEGPFGHNLIQSDQKRYKLTKSERIAAPSACHCGIRRLNCVNYFFVRTHSREGPDAIRPVYDAFASTGVRPLRGSSMGPPDPALGGRARFQRGLDRRASHRALGTASRARSPDRASLDGDPPYPARPRRGPAALPSSGGARQPGRDARPHGSGPA